MNHSITSIIHSTLLLSMTSTIWFFNAKSAACGLFNTISTQNPAASTHPPNRTLTWESRHPLHHSYTSPSSWNTQPPTSPSFSPWRLYLIQPFNQLMLMNLLKIIHKFLICLKIPPANPKKILLNCLNHSLILQLIQHFLSLVCSLTTWGTYLNAWQFA